MQLEEIKKELSEFRNMVDKFDHLLLESRDNAIPEIVKNHEEIAKQRSELNRAYARLEEYIKKLGNNPRMSDGVNPVIYSVYNNAFSADILPRVGPSIDAVLQDLDYILGKLSKLSEEEFKELLHPKKAKKEVQINGKIEDFNYFSITFNKMSKKIQELLNEINHLPKTRIEEYSSLIAHQLRTLLRLILIQWWEDINKETIPKSKRAGLEDLIQYSINNSISNKLNGAKAVVKQLEEIKKYKTMTDNTIHDEGTTVDSDDCAKYRANLKNIISSIYR